MRCTSLQIVLLLCLRTLQSLSHASIVQLRLTEEEVALGLRTISRSSRCPVIYDDPPAHTSSRATPRIISGDPVSDKVAPSLVALYKGDGFGNLVHSCTGTLVSSRWVITAAHCNVGVGLDAAVLLSRNTDVSVPENSNAVKLSIAKAYNHEGFFGNDSESRKYDIAAIELAGDAPADAVPMKVNVNMNIPEANSFIRVIGFGDTIEGDESNAPHQLAQVDVPVVASDECAKIHEDVSNVDIDHNAHVCVGYMGKGGCGACHGDSGGPLIQYDSSGEPVLVATVSAGVRCADGHFPTVNMRVANFRDWLDNQVGAEYTPSEATSPIFQENGGISASAIAGIVIAFLVFIIVLVAAVIVVRRKRRNSEEEIQTVPAVGPPVAPYVQPPAPYAYGGQPPPLPGTGSTQPRPHDGAGGNMPSPVVPMSYVPPTGYQLARSQQSFQPQPRSSQATPAVSSPEPPAPQEAPTVPPPEVAPERPS